MTTDRVRLTFYTSSTTWVGFSRYCQFWKSRYHLKQIYGVETGMWFRDPVIGLF